MLKLKGLRTIIVNVLIGVIALAEFATEKVHMILCDNFQTACESSFWAWLTGVTLTLNTILRFVTDTPVGRAK